MTDMLSVVARAIRQKCAELEHRPGVHEPDIMWFADEYAKAAIEALEEQGLVIVPREPTDEMKTAGLDPFVAHATSPMFSGNEPCGPIFRAMIDKALEGKP